MLFFSSGKSPSLLYRSGGVNFIDTPQGMMRQTHQPKWIKFRALNAPIFQPGLPGKGEYPNEAWGRLNTETVAEDIDEPQKEIEKFLLKHKEYGLSFIAVSEDTGSEADFVDSEMIVTQKGKGNKKSFYCKLCERSLATAQAVNGHKTSDKHQDLRDSYMRHLKLSRAQVRIR